MIFDLLTSLGARFCGFRTPFLEKMVVGNPQLHVARYAPHMATCAPPRNSNWEEGQMAKEKFWQGFAAGAAAGTLAGIGSLLGWNAVSSARDRRILHLEKSIQIGRPVNQVFRSWSDLESLPQRSQFITRIERHGTRSRWWVKIDGREFQWNAELIQNIPNQALAWKSLGRPRHSGRIHFASLGADTMVHVVMNYAPPLGFFSRAASSLEPYLEDAIGRVLRDFKSALEARSSQPPSAATGTYGMDPTLTGHTQHSRFGGPNEINETASPAPAPFGQAGTKR
jgi:uncharacterized membrane protein